MEKVFQRLFEPSRFHTIGQRWCIQGRKYHRCSRSPPSCQIIVGCRLQWHATGNAQSLEERSSLTYSCVSSGMVFLKGTERLANWGGHSHAKNGDRMH